MTSISEITNMVKFRADHGIRVCQWLAGIVVAVASPICAGQLQAMQFRKVAETGAAAPGTEPGVVFGALTTGLNQNLLIPKMDESGRVAFMGLLTGPGIDISNFQGMWAEQDGVLQLVARNGQPAPGTGQGILFRGVPSLEVPFAPEGRGNNIAFHAQLIGAGVDVTNDEGIWRGGPGNLALLAREGSPVPGQPSLTFGVPSVFINSTGHVVLRSSLRGPGVNETNRDALFTDRSGVLSLLLHEGDSAPSTESGTVYGGNAVFERILFNENSKLALTTTLAGPAVSDSNDQALYVERNDMLQLVIREGGPVPGAEPGVTFGGNTPDLGLSFLVFNNKDRLAFVSNLGGASKTQPALFSDRMGTVAAVAISGQRAPGTDFDYTFFGSAILNDVNQIAFDAAFPDNGDIFTPPPFGVFSDVGGSITLVVAPGDTTLEGEAIDDARVIGFNSAGQMLLNLQIHSATSRIGLWLRNPDGAIHRIAATGDHFDLSGDRSDVRDVTRVVTGRMNEAGQIAIRLDFSDNSSAHFAASLSCGLNAKGGDFDGDGNVDLFDFQKFQDCFGAAASVQCLCAFDVDDDGDVGSDDLAGFEGNFIGPE